MLRLFLFASVALVAHGFNQLAFSGGGAFGAVEVGISKKVNEIDPKNYDLYTGISAGGILTGFLSYYSDFTEGINVAEKLISNLKNREVYEVHPSTGVSILNTAPLNNTLTKILSQMKNEPAVKTLIGTTNLYTGGLDIYDFKEIASVDRPTLLLCTSAIPVVFPPVTFKEYQYADGGTLDNSLLSILHDTDEYLNVTFITPFDGYLTDTTPIKTIEDYVKRTAVIVASTFDNDLNKMYQGCDWTEAIGQITKYYIDASLLDNYSMLNFDKGDELVQLGYDNVKSMVYKIC